MNWDLLDFLAFGVMVTVALTIVVLAGRRTRSGAYRAAAAIAALGAFLLVWVNGAVGIIGNEENDANMMFFGVLGVAAVGAVIARFRASGMARALYATAAAQVLVAAVAIVMQAGATGANWPNGLVIITVFFAATWIVSGALFGKAARAERRLFGDRTTLHDSPSLGRSGNSKLQ
jgi:hypothetical protein